MPLRSSIGNAVDFNVPFNVIPGQCTVFEKFITLVFFGLIIQVTWYPLNTNPAPWESMIHGGKDEVPEFAGQIMILRLFFVTVSRWLTSSMIT